ncbi:MAG: glutaredoxin family protein [Burkholderiaceae bacterium]
MRRLALIALLAAAGVASAQYRWVDPDGGVNYGDVPPANARQVQPIKAGAAPIASGPELPFELRRAVLRNPVTLYTAANCGEPCAAARTYLRGRGVPFAEHIVQTQADVDAFRRATRAESLPAITVGSEVAAGFASASWESLLGAAGYPDRSQLPPGWRDTPAQPMNTPSPKAVAAPAKEG